MGWLHFVFNSIYTFRVFYGIQPVGCSEHLGKLTNLLWLLAPEILQSYVYPRQDSDVEIRALWGPYRHFQFSLFFRVK